MHHIRQAEAARTAEEFATQRQQLNRALLAVTDFISMPEASVTDEFMRMMGWQRLAEFLETQHQWTLALEYWQRWDPSGNGCGTWSWWAVSHQAKGIDRCKQQLGR